MSAHNSDRSGAIPALCRASCLPADTPAPFCPRGISRPIRPSNHQPSNHQPSFLLQACLQLPGLFSLQKLLLGIGAGLIRSTCADSLATGQSEKAFFRNKTSILGSPYYSCRCFNRRLYKELQSFKKTFLVAYVVYWTKLYLCCIFSYLNRRYVYSVLCLLW